MSKPTVLIVAIDEADFFKTKHKPFLDLLELVAEVEWVLKGQVDTAFESLSTYKAVLVIDPGLKISKYTSAVQKLIEYVRDDGGRAICMGLFAAFINHTGISRFFGELWDMPWHQGDYYAGDYIRNTKLKEFDGKGLDDIYYQKALCLGSVGVESAFYVPSQGALPQQPNYMGLNNTTLMQAALIHERVGNGYLCYVGDSEGEPETNKAILAMAGLAAQ